MGAEPAYPGDRRPTFKVVNVYIYQQGTRGIRFCVAWNRYIISLVFEKADPSRRPRLHQHTLLDPVPHRSMLTQFLLFLRRNLFLSQLLVLVVESSELEGEQTVVSFLKHAPAQLGLHAHPHEFVVESPNLPIHIVVPSFEVIPMTPLRKQFFLFTWSLHVFPELLEHGLMGDRTINVQSTSYTFVFLGE